jgi:hypothetical protein
MHAFNARINDVVRVENIILLIASLVAVLRRNSRLFHYNIVLSSRFTCWFQLDFYVAR